MSPKRKTALLRLIRVFVLLAVIAAADGNGAPQVLLITVTVTTSGGDSVSVSGYRTRYAPNALP